MSDVSFLTLKWWRSSTVRIPVWSRGQNGLHCCTNLQVLIWPQITSELNSQRYFPAHTADYIRKRYYAIFFFQRIQCIEFLWSYANQIISSIFDIDLIYRSHTLGPSQSSVREQLEIVTQIALKHGGDGIVCVEGKEENERLWTLRKECLWSAMARCLILYR